MKRIALAAGLACAAMAAARPVLAQAPVPAPSASPSPAPERRRLFVSGPQVASAGFAVAPRVQSEFAPGSTLGFTTLALWQAGETTLLGRFRVASYTDYRLLTYPHATSAVTTIGGSGSTIVPAFHVHANALESGGGIRVLPGVFAGLGTIGIQGNAGYPPIRGVGYVLMLEPQPQPIVAPYARFFFTGNAGGSYALANGQGTALTYRGWRYHAGVLIREPGTRLALDVGYAGERLLDRTNAPATVQDATLTLGLALRF